MKKQEILMSSILVIMITLKEVYIMKQKQEYHLMTVQKYLLNFY